MQAVVSFPIGLSDLIGLHLQMTQNITPTPQKKLIFMGGILLIIMIMVLVYLVMLNNSSESEQEMAVLRESITNKESALRAQGVAVPLDRVSIEVLSQRISRDALQLSESIGDFQQILSQKEQTLSKTQNDLQAALVTNQNLSAKTLELRARLDKSDTQQMNEALYKQQIERLERDLQARDAKIVELEKRPPLEEVREFTAQLNQAMLNNEKLTLRVKELEIPAPGVGDLTQIQNLIKENKSLREALELSKKAN